MSKLKEFDVYIIRHKETKAVFTAPSGKTSWKKPAHAKNAWSTINSRWFQRAIELQSLLNKCNIGEAIIIKNKYGRFELPKFDDQDTYEIIKISGSVTTQLEKAERILNLASGRCDMDIQREIDEYFKDKE
tara:strand:+ start:18310 stop:18702 length:393 start_codon:yes stop_codon:yes gene_type:complete